MQMWKWCRGLPPSYVRPLLHMSLTCISYEIYVPIWFKGTAAQTQTPPPLRSDCFYQAQTAARAAITKTHFATHFLWAENRTECIKLLWAEVNWVKWNQAELGFGPEWTEVPLNFPSIEMNLTQREYRPVLPAADKWSPACVCVSLVSAVWLVLLGLLLLNVRHIQATHTFGRCGLSGVSALAVEQLSWEMYLCMKRASNTERARWVRTQCFHTQRAM